MSKEVIVIGGGFAGLTAAFDLSRAGFKVKLLEKRGILGGRAHSFVDELTKCEIDNGQHVLMGCYKNTIKFLSEINSLDNLSLKKYLSVDFADRNSRRYEMKCNILPFPWNLFKGIFGYNKLTAEDKIKIINLFKTIRKINDIDGMSVSELLEKYSQTENSVKYFYSPVVLAMLNENIRNASAELFVNTLRNSLLANKESSAFAFPKNGMSSFYVKNAIEAIKKNKGEIISNCEAVTARISDYKVEHLEMKNGEKIKADFYISAVPFYDLKNILPSNLTNEKYFEKIFDFKCSPIISVNLWTNKIKIDLVGSALIESDMQWVFNKNEIFSLKDDFQYLSFIISKADEYMDLSKEKLTEMALFDLRQCFPQTRDCQVFHSLVIKEPFATLSQDAAFIKKRPSFKTPLENLFLAGDWTNTGFPCSIESAVFSGYSCSKLVQDAQTASLNLQKM